jgi:chemotaxis protein MotB
VANKKTDSQAPIIVKKIKKGGHGHHGGAWKVAYADFVTAMMAFFLLMWLLNATTEEQRKGIAEYFDPTPMEVSSATSGAGGVMGGMTVSPDGARVNDTSSHDPQRYPPPASVTKPTPIK